MGVGVSTQGVGVYAQGGRGVCPVGVGVSAQWVGGVCLPGGAHLPLWTDRHL